MLTGSYLGAVAIKDHIWYSASGYSRGTITVSASVAPAASIHQESGMSGLGLATRATTDALRAVIQLGLQITGMRIYLYQAHTLSNPMHNTSVRISWLAGFFP
jgi:hypothetical protein